MKHLGDITKIDGAAVPVVDVVTFGAPCQDISLAGLRKGMKHEAQGDGETTRSGLFFEAIRIIKEMRENDKRTGRTGSTIRPRYAVYENVPGLFSSNKGEDFRKVLEEMSRIAEPDAVIPRPEKNKWRTSGCIMGDGWSIAWRVLDAQFWGVPQRRRRIALVADFGGHAAPEILFIRKSVCGHITESGTPGEEAAAGTGIGADPSVYCLQGNGIDRSDTAGCSGKGWTQDVSYTLNTIDRHAVGICQKENDVYAIHQNQTREVRQRCVANTLNTNGNASGRNAPLIFDARGNGDGQTVCTLTGDHQNRVTDYTALVMTAEQADARITPALYENHGQDGRLTGPLDVSPTISRKFGTGGNNTPLVMATGQAGAEIIGDKAPTLNCNHEQPIVYREEGYGTYELGFETERASRDTLGGGSESLICHLRSESENGTYPAVANALTSRYDGSPCVDRGPNIVLQPADINERTVRRLTPLEAERLQSYPDGWTDIGAWTDSKGKLHKESSDSARYKALGNSIALPPWKWVLKRISAQYERCASMASLFDGISGFPLIWTMLNGIGSVKWVSEIEEFPIAVCKRHFGNEETGEEGDLWKILSHYPCKS